MKSRLKRLVTLAIIAITFMQLIACGKTSKTSGDEVSKYVYVAEYQELPEAESVQNICIASDKIYYTNYKWDEATGSSTTGLYALAFGETVPIGIPLKLKENSSINNLRLDVEGNIWILINNYVFDESSEYGGTSTYELLKVDEQGNQLQNVDITPMLEDEESPYIQYMEFDGAGNIYLSNSDSAIWVLDSEGKLLFKLPLDNWLNSIGSSKDGTVIISQYGNEGIEMKSIDVTTKSFGNTYTELPVANGNSMIVSGINSDILINSGNTLVEYNFETKEQLVLLNWIDCDINSDNIRTVRALEDGRIVTVSSDHSSSEGQTEVIYLTRKEASEVATKKTLTFGTLSLNSQVRDAIIKFNKTNDTYRITVKEYLTDYNDYEATIAQFNSDISTGSGADIIDLSYGISMSSYASKGIFEDLYPYIEQDSEIKLDDYLENIFRAYEIDGKLYGMISNFYITTLIGKTADVGVEMGWKIDDLVELLESRPEGTTIFNGATKSSVLSTLVMYNMNQFINWETGECTFNSESFEKILEFSNKFDAEFIYSEDNPSEPSLIQSGQQLLMYTSISGVEGFQMNKLMFEGDITFIGFPTEEGNGSLISPSDASMAMNANSDNKEGAWEFMRYFLTEDYQVRENAWSFPVLKSALDKMYEEAMKSNEYEDENGNMVVQPKTTWGYNDWTAEIYAATEEDTAQLNKLINSVDTVSSYNLEVYAIISEEAEAFFSGSKNVKDVSDIIQSRVQIYVNETK